MASRSRTSQSSCGQCCPSVVVHCERLRQTSLGRGDRAEVTFICKVRKSERRTGLVIRRERDMHCLKGRTSPCFCECQVSCYGIPDRKVYNLCISNNPCHGKEKAKTKCEHYSVKDSGPVRFLETCKYTTIIAKLHYQSMEIVVSMIYKSPLEPWIILQPSSCSY